MNIKLITLTAAVAMTAAMAQERLITSADAPASEEATAPASEPTLAPAPAPAPAPKAQTLILAPQAAPAPAQEEAPAAKPALHGIAYNNVGNQAADATVADNLNKPYKSSSTWNPPAGSAPFRSAKEARSSSPSKMPATSDVPPSVSQTRASAHLSATLSARNSPSPKPVTPSTRKPKTCTRSLQATWSVQGSRFRWAAST